MRSLRRRLGFVLLPAALAAPLIIVGTAPAQAITGSICGYSGVDTNSYINFQYSGPAGSKVPLFSTSGDVHGSITCHISSATWVYSESRIYKNGVEIAYGNNYCSDSCRNVQVRSEGTYHCTSGTACAGRYTFRQDYQVQLTGDYLGSGSVPSQCTRYASNGMTCVFQNVNGLNVPAYYPPAPSEIPPTG